MDASENKSNASTSAACAPAAEKLMYHKFLESCGVDSWQSVSDLLTTNYNGHTVLASPEIELYCERCQGVRRFNNTSQNFISPKWNNEFVEYGCKNCGRTRKIFALAVIPESDNKSGRVLKLGEYPPFGPPTPARLIKLIGPDRELFLQGRRAELHGLGIGAFAYYRRVVEEQKGRIIEEVGKVAQRIKPSKETAELFAKAAAETQFSTAIELIKAALPESLLIDGHNPLTLLHDALSEGLHEHTDEECLHLATSIRVVLAELAERMSLALKDEADLKTAVSRLLSRKSSQTESQ